MWGAGSQPVYQAGTAAAAESRRAGLPSSQELTSLGRQLMLAPLAAPRAVELAESIRNTAVPGVHGRLVESFAVPAAMHAVMLHGRDVTREVAVETLRRMIGDRAARSGRASATKYGSFGTSSAAQCGCPSPDQVVGTVHVDAPSPMSSPQTMSAKRTDFAHSRTHAELDSDDDRGGHGHPHL